MAELAYEMFTAAAPEAVADVVFLRPDAAPTALLERAQALADAGRLGEAAGVLADVLPQLPAGRPRLALRALQVEAWVALGEGRVDEALDGLQKARGLAENPVFTDADRGETLYRLGACQLKRSSTAAAISLLTLSLELFDRCPDSSDTLRANALVWRSRCYQRRRDWQAARADVERALELAESLGDDHTVAHATFQASLIAEREGQFHLACFYAEGARKLYAAVDDRLNVARLTNNLGGLAFLLGHTEDAARQLEEAHRLAFELGSDADAAQALSSLAQVHLRTGEHGAAEIEARQALELLEGRPDFLDEVGQTQLVLGRALLEQERFDEAAVCFHVADESFEQIGSTSHRAAAWIAEGDLAGRRGDCETAASQYRRAAESLQDFHF
jgi:tetratricopeptide (TPR) repeat protein